MRDGPLLPRPRPRAHRRRTTSARTRASREAAAEISDATGKPILTATELAVAAPDNPGPRPCAPPAGSVTRARTARSPRSRTSWRVRALPPRASRGDVSPARARRGRAVLCVVALVRAAGAVTSAALVRRPTSRGRGGGTRRRRRCARRCGRRAGCPPVRRSHAAQAARSPPTSPAPSPRSTRASRSTTRTGPLARIGGRPRARARVDAEAAHGGRRARDARPRPPVHDPRGPRRRRDDLVVVGGGDPLLATPAVRTRASTRELRYRERAVHRPRRARRRDRRGRRAARSRRARRRRPPPRLAALPPDWKPNYAPDGEVGALGALAVDGGFADRRAARPAADPALAPGQRLADVARAARRHGRGRRRRGAAPPDARRSRARRLAAARRRRRRDAERERQLHRRASAPRDRRPTRRRRRPQRRWAPRRSRARRSTARRAAHGVVAARRLGLAPDDRVGCPTLLGVVELTNRRASRRSTEGLPVAGRSGTLAARFLGDRLAGVLRAKTGYARRRRRRSPASSTPRPNPASRSSPTATSRRRAASALQAAVAHAVASYPSHVDTAELVPATLIGTAPRLRLAPEQAARRDSSAVPGATSGLSGRQSARDEYESCETSSSRTPSRRRSSRSRGSAATSASGSAARSSWASARCSSPSACCVSSRTQTGTHLHRQLVVGAVRDRRRRVVGRRRPHLVATRAGRRRKEPDAVSSDTAPTPPPTGRSRATTSRRSCASSAARSTSRSSGVKVPAIAIAVGVAVATVVVAYWLGRRRGKKRQMVLEIRRI